jgi:hypothetical protein
LVQVPEWVLALALVPETEQEQEPVLVEMQVEYIQLPK